MSYVIMGGTHNEVHQIYLAETRTDAETCLERIDAFKSKHEENVWIKIVKETGREGLLNLMPIRFIIKEITGVIVPGGESIR